MSLFNPSPTIALLTDFGQSDWYVAAMKGRILARLPEARLVDVSHAVPPGDVEAGAFLLRCVMDAMPEGTIFLCVVDPGVGTARRALCGRIGRFGFAGPDNGLATPLLHAADFDFALHEIASTAWQEPVVSTTFHGRDLFAPAAAMLARGCTPAEAGPAALDPRILPHRDAHPTERGLTARIMLVDHFGNLITNLAKDTTAQFLSGKFTIRAGSLSIQTLAPSFGHVAKGEALAYWGSAGTLEIAINGGSAAAQTGLKLGDSISVELWPA